MTSKYRELSELSENARLDLIGHQNRCLQYMVIIVDEMLKYCEIPLDRVTYLRWNEEEKVLGNQKQQDIITTLSARWDSKTLEIADSG